MFLIPRDRWRVFFLTALLCYFATQSEAQNFYPDEIGNTWLLRSVDGFDERRVTIKRPQVINEETLKVIEDETDGNASEFFVKSELDGVKLFRSIVFIVLIGPVTFNYSPSQLFLPIPIDIGAKWQIEGETTIPLIGQVHTITDAEVIAIEDVVVPAGTFRDTLRIVQTNTLDAGIAQFALATTLWLAPDIGPVKAIDSNEIVFELVSFNIANPPDVAVQLKGKLATVWASIKMSK